MSNNLQILIPIGNLCTYYLLDSANMVKLGVVQVVLGVVQAAITNRFSDSRLEENNERRC